MERKLRLPHIPEGLLVALGIFGLYASVVGLMWDVWWHMGVGRDNFFIPPHLMVYGGTMLALGVAALGWWQTRKGAWASFMYALLLIPLAGVFDEWWHGIFGIEDLTSPMVIWSPPHLMLVGGILFGAWTAMNLIPKAWPIEDRFFLKILSFATIFAIAHVLTDPFWPNGPWGFRYFWGTGIVAFNIVFLLKLAKHKIGTRFAALPVLALALVPLMIKFVEPELAPNIRLVEFAHVPTWLPVFALLAAALVIDFISPRRWLTGGIIAGVLWSVIVGGFGSLYVEEAFQYGTPEIVVLVGSSAIGGLAAAYIILLRRRRLAPSTSDYDASARA